MKIVSSGKCSMYFFLLIISLVFSSCIKDPSLLEGQEGGFGFKYYGSGERIGSVGGTILDAQNGDPIGDAKVYVKNYEEETTTYTDPDGHYFIPDIFLGIQVLVIIKPGFIIEEVKVDLFEEEESKDETNVAILPNDFGNDKYVIVLSWREEPADLDAHLYVPAPGSPSEIYWHDKGDNDGRLDSNPFAALDVDDRDGIGPETVTIKADNVNRGPKYDGTYRYYVKKYDGIGEITESEAVVRVYLDGALVKTFNVPKTGTGNYWRVFDLDTDGNFTIYNTIEHRRPGAP
ncbi:MAG: hypothetical protein ISR65_01775 [Bacteriovoracaceae bacterium]|nr:hypothetical protein [Bacteriovoracaceae bacterium]